MPIKTNTISMQALEYSQKHDRIPSCILAVGEGSAAGTGGLYHGGFKAIMNAEFLRKERVTHIVNTAKGLEIFGPKYLVGFSLFCNVHSKCRLNCYFVPTGGCGESQVSAGSTWNWIQVFQT